MAGSDYPTGRAGPEADAPGVPDPTGRRRGGIVWVAWVLAFILLLLIVCAIWFWGWHKPHQNAGPQVAAPAGVGVAVV